MSERVIKFLELERGNSGIIYLVPQINENELFIPIEVTESADYKCNIIFEDGYREELPLDIFFKEGGPKSEDFKKYSILKELNNYRGDDEYNINTKFYIEKLPNKIFITDETESDFNDYGNYSIFDKDLWVSNGLRRCKVDFEKINNSFINKLEFKLEKSMGDHIEYLVKLKKNEEGFELLLDTDKIGEILMIKDESSWNVRGTVSSEMSENKKNKDSKIVIKYPIELNFINPLKSNVWNKNKVSIDFGTSSTCIAYGKNMLHFSEKVDSEEDYENSTSFVIFDWEGMKEQWNKSNKAIPSFIKAKSKTNKLSDIKNVHFGDGNNVKTLLKDPTKEILGSTVLELKTMVTEINKTNKFRQFLNYSKSYDITMNFGEDAEIDPIAFYAYLIGRKINSQVKSEIYTDFHITMPVKFSENNKNRILKSFEYGLKRSVPKMLQEKINVYNKYNEPTAILGSQFSNELNVEIKGEPIFFSVFDFGGGTLDYVFGAIRKSSENQEFQVLEDEDEYYEYIIELFDNGGDDECGGEKILKRMAYKIYLQNIDILGKDIPIMLPRYEDKCDKISSGLYGDEIKNQINLKMLVEKVAREILYSINFEKKGDRNWISNIKQDIKSNLDEVIWSDEEDEKWREEKKNKPKSSPKNTATTNIKTFNTISLCTTKAEEYRTVDINVDLDKIIDFYVEYVTEHIEGFIDKLEDIIKSDNFKRFEKETGKEITKDDFKIFLAGNSCKSIVVQRLMKKKFDGDSIKIINNEEKGKEVTMKTAVARGVLKYTDQFYIHDWKKSMLLKDEEKNELLKFNILNKGAFDDHFETILPKNTPTSKEWKKLCRFDTENYKFEINYTQSDKKIIENDTVLKNDTIEISKPVINNYMKEGHKLHTIYIKAYGEDKIIYCLGKKNSFNENMANNIEFLKTHCVITLN